MLLFTAGAGPVQAAPVSGELGITLQQGFPWQGLSMFTIVMALLYAGHLAQDRTSLGWRLVLFILGFPLTFIVSFLVVPGSQRVLGVDLPRHDLQSAGAPESTAAESGASDSAQDRKAGWDGLIALAIGVSLVLLVAPSTEYRSQPMDDHRLHVEKTMFLGFWDRPWLSYRREGVQHRDGEEGWVEPEWTTDRQWTFEATPEMVLTLVMLLIVFVLCVRDERKRTRALEARSGPPQRAG
ncbi:hypothetical protein HFP89_03695 [Wenzhouxiangella sp. XN79A]|uniref:hypothetical protein n=1 Tax=Wenzhouxiangella sp. XN79A TaxID=2724193 RepID=UPI00144AE212|nr:hypothetical protein [Wenzhouxiangella sp. XN79A]NKI34262.1 hypothetical protein [Wenzhouxiangella sp. XN79A]